MQDELKILELVSTNIKRIRLSQKISQEELAFRCGLSKNYLSDVERGQRNITIVVLAKILHGLNADINELFKPINQ